MIGTLIVEDSPTSMALLENILGRDPDICVAGQADTGLQAVALANQIQPNMILMDVTMPDMDGLEATRRILAHKPTPIIIVTAYADSAEMNVVFEAMKAGALDVIAKPTGMGDEQIRDWGDGLITKIKVLSGVRPKSMD